MSLTITISYPETSTLWRVPHDIERVSFDAKDYRYRPNIGMTGYGTVRGAVMDTGDPMPEVYRLQPDQTTPIGEAHQWMWRRLNPDLSAAKFCTLLGNGLAWTNRTGWPGRRNYILMQDLNEEFPRFHAALINGGAIVEGDEREGRVYIKSLLISDPVPDRLLDFPRLWFWGTSVNKEGEVNLIHRLGMDGDFHPVRVPLLHKVPVWLSVNELHRLLPGSVIPDPRWTI